jgi:hypothetical protein
MALAAMVRAWTPDQVKQILVASERSKLDHLPADLRHHSIRALDNISCKRFGKTFGALLSARLNPHRPIGVPPISLQDVDPAAAVDQ